MADVFDQAFLVVIGAEGGFTADPRDTGNWTGGKIGSGQLVGTKYGISAASYPSINIPELTLDGAKAIYKTDYWDQVSGDQLPPPVALIIFDSAVNSGVKQAVRWLQGAAGVQQDGVPGPKTLAAVTSAKLADVVTEILARRLLFLAGLSNWQTYSGGWTRRVLHLAMAIVAFEEPTVVAVQGAVRSLGPDQVAKVQAVIEELKTVVGVAA